MTLFIRNFPETVHREVRVLAAAERRTLKDTVADLLREGAARRIQAWQDPAHVPVPVATRPSDRTE